LVNIRILLELRKHATQGVGEKGGNIAIAATAYDLSDWSAPGWLDLCAICTT
jgi:hypothetical protein